jgi:hypothetical protein
MKNRFRTFVVICLLGSGTAATFASPDPLAARDEWGKLTPGPLNPTDFEHRHPFRFFYYFENGSELNSNPAYIGAVQAGLRRKGYFDGPIDGVFSPEVSAAICRLQKAYAQRVTGTLTRSVRRALYLP